MGSRFLVGALLVAILAAVGCRRQEADAGTETPSAELAEEWLDQVRALPYADWVPAERGDGRFARGVTDWDRKRATAGLNLYTPREHDGALLVDMRGEVVHRWTVQTERRLPWQHVRLLPDGDLLVVVRDHYLARLAWDSTVRWAVQGRFHHDVAVDAAGTLYAPESRSELATIGGRQVPVVAEYVAILAPNGERLDEIALLPLVADLVPEAAVVRAAEWAADRGDGRGERPHVDTEGGSPGDLLHLNSIDVLPRDVPGLGRQGDLLLSIRNLDLLAVVDPETLSLGWTWGPGELEEQHHAQVLPNEHVLVFDNGTRRGWSRVLEIAPRTGEIAWSYQADEPRSFSSFRRGGAQRLASGNTLVTESDRGRVFEVDPQGDLVWQFFCPELVDTEGPQPKRAAIYRMTRVFPQRGDELAALLRASSRGRTGTTTSATSDG